MDFYFVTQILSSGYFALKVLSVYQTVRDVHFKGLGKGMSKLCSFFLNYLLPSSSGRKGGKKSKSCRFYM